MKSRGLLLILLVLLSQLPLLFAQIPVDTDDFVVRHRVLSEDESLKPRQVRDGRYYIIDVGFPISEDVYNVLSDEVTLERFMAPSYYIIKGDRDAIERLDALDLIGDIWRYTSKYNVEPSLVDKETLIAEIVMFPSTSPERRLNRFEWYGDVITVHDRTVLVETKGKRLDSLAKTEGVEFVREYVQPEVFNDAAVTITGVDQGREARDVYGEGQIIAIADTGLDTGVLDSSMHDDFQGRILDLQDLTICCSSSPDDLNGHGTHVAGIALGDGTLSNSIPSTNQYSGSYAGVAPKAQLIFQAIGDDSGTTAVYPPMINPGLFTPAYDQGARIHSNSWGIYSPTFFGTYHTPAQDIDSFIWGKKDMTIVFAVGNWAYQSGAYQSDTIAPHAVAKNAISVGGTENFKPTIADPPSIADDPDDLYLSGGRGPTDDGRVKPDVVAPGTEIFSTKSRVAPFPGGTCTKTTSSSGSYNIGPDYATCIGTSMATPHIAGMVALLREFYQTTKNVKNPSAALLKASLINSGEDIGYGIPSDETGWGRANLDNVLSDTHDLFFLDETKGLATGQKQTCQIDNVGSGHPFKITVVWSDKEAAILSPIHLVNDLDLVVKGPNGVKYFGNDFTAPFASEKDHINNVEQVIIDNPAAGDYSLTIKGKNVPFPKQPFAMVLTYNQVMGRSGYLTYPILCNMV
jgi:subtilisin family serine protease